MKKIKTDSMMQPEGNKKVSQGVSSRAKLYAEAMKSVFEAENGGSEFVAIDLDTLVELDEQEKEWVLEELRSLPVKQVCILEDIKDDETKFEYRDGQLMLAKNGTILSVRLISFEENQAEIEATSWFGNVGAVFITYTAKYQNGKWFLKEKHRAVS
ncbi:MAG: hypothetical protein Q8M92_08340 [Candidatus Subteraquimicrobiales bacterium]|nr:hypothetical protein [Candidatus Subteraquimicrobiales bacterium]